MVYFVILSPGGLLGSLSKMDINLNLRIDLKMPGQLHNRWIIDSCSTSSVQQIASGHYWTSYRQGMRLPKSLR